MTITLLLTALAAALIVGAWLSARTVRAFKRANQRVNADVAFARAIPADMDWSGER